MPTPKFDERVSLSFWPPERQADTVESQEFPTLTEAMRAAGEALARGGGEPWIVLADGEILAPTWIKAQLTRT